MELQVIRQQPEPSEATRDPEQIRPVVLAWRDSLSAGLKDHLSTSLEWDESSAAQYFTDKPTWDCYGDLLLWAAYDEQPELHRPEQHVADWSTDAAYQLILQQSIPSRYTHLYEVALWLPCDFGFTFKSADVGGAEVLVGSSVALLRQLEELNARTWRLSPEELQQWRRNGADYGAPLESGARFAFSVFFELTQEATRHRLPMRMDW